MTSAQGTNVGAPHGAIRARQGEDDAAAVMTTGGGVGLDVVNAWFRKHYPANLDRSLFAFRSGHRSGWEAPSGVHGRIFPEIVCANGTRMSVQGHYGAYCWPCDDFSEDPYTQVEVLAYKPVPAAIWEWAQATGRKPTILNHGEEKGRLFAFVPTHVICKAIEDCGGIADPSSASETEVLQGNAESPSSSDLNATGAPTRPPE